MNTVTWTVVAAIFGASGAAAEREFVLTDYGAVGDGKTLCTAALGKALAACAAAGGGTVRVPKGTFLTGAVRLRGHLRLQIDKGATLLGSRNRADYYLPPRSGSGEKVFVNLLQGTDLENVTIAGEGTIDGNGSAFRDKTRRRPKCIYLHRCRNVRIEGVRMRAAGSWMQHYRTCEKLVIRGIDVFNHVSFNNDGLNVDSCRDVTIERCRIDSDDDGIVLKSLSRTPCRSVHIRDCVVSSHCNAIKMGTESGGGFVDVTVERCTVFSPKKSKVIYGRQRGLAGIALEIVDGGRMENVRVSKIDIDGVTAAIFLRLGNRARVYEGKKGEKNRKPAVGTMRNVTLSDITARRISPTGCALSGLPDHPIRNVTLTNVRLAFDGGGERKLASRQVPERPASYPESTMFGPLPAYGLYCRHITGLHLTNVTLTTTKPDLRHALVMDDVQHVTLRNLQADWSKGAAALVRLAHARQVTLDALSPKKPVDTLVRLEGSNTTGIVLTGCDLQHVSQVVDTGQRVPKGAWKQQSPTQRGGERAVPPRP